MKIKKFLFVITTMFLMVQGASAWNGSGSSGDPYQITSTADWNTLATSTDEYSDTFFKLTADITVTTMRTKTFKGTFDGGGHTLTFNYTATGDNAAPFAYISGATIKNLRVAGTITTSKQFAAGIVAISNGGSIENCRSSVTIDSSTSGDGTHGGLVADSYQGRLDINNCLFDGKLLGKNTTNCGGIVGWHKQGTLNITNTLFAPAEVTVQVQGGAIFARNGATSLNHCYYISDWSAATVQGTNANSMTAAALVTALNNGDKNWCVHRGNAIPIMVNLVISTKAQWDTFAANVGNYDGKYVQLSANIGTANAPITTMTTTNPSFKGIFDGNGHTLTVNFSADTGNEGAFRYLNDGTIMNLTITGTVTAGGNYASGLVARTSGGDCLIDNCVVNTNVEGSGYAGGIVAHGDNATKLTITNCIYGGEISKVSSFSGGILGWYNNNGTMDLVINNCLCKGIYTGTADFHPIGLKRATNCSFKSISCTNCYYTTNPHNPGGRNFTDGTKVCELSLGDDVTASGSTCTFEGITYHYGMVTLGYNGPMATTNFSLDGTHLNENSFTISTDNAAFDDGTATIKWDFPGRGTVGDPYQISSAAVWDFLADEVNNGNTYSEKCFQLTNSISVTTMVGVGTTDGNYKSFNGTFDGNGHTLNVAFSGSGAWMAAFGALNGATIKNLHITGSISTSDYRPGSIAGFISGNSTITNCWSEVAISSSKENSWVDAGAFVARVNSGTTLTLNGCLFTGSITYIDDKAYEGGGMVGWAQNNTTVKFYDCVFAPSAISITKYQDQYTFAATYDGYATKTIDNCYYNDVANALVKTDTEPGFMPEGLHWHSITAGTDVTISDLGATTATYNVSGITAYSRGLKCNGTYYAGESESVSLTLGHTSHSGYSLHGYSVTLGSLANPTTNSPTLTMPAENVTVNVTYSASKNITGYDSDANGWYLIASPIGTVNPANVLNMTREDIHTYDIFRFNQNPPSNAGNYLEWENWNEASLGLINHNHFDLEPGRGYLYANDHNVELTFVGTPYSGSGQVTLVRSSSNGNTDGRMLGWNLIGNPFGESKTIGQAFYRMNNDHTDLIASTDDIAPMEGVFVYRDAQNGPESVTFTTSGAKGNESHANNIVINLSGNASAPSTGSGTGSAGTIIDRAIVSFEEGRRLPKFQINENSTKLYIPQNGADYAIAFSDRTGEIPLNFKAAKNGSYTLTVDAEGIEAGYLYLIDNMTGANVDLLAQPSYTFTAKTTDYESRFRLVFSANGPSTGSGTDEPFAFFANGEWIVLNEGEATLQVIDIIGRQLLSEKAYSELTPSNASHFRIPNSAFSTSGVYILRLINGDSVRTQKIVVR